MRQLAVLVWPVRAILDNGAAINWIDSSLLLQKFSSDEMMGRLSSADFSLALLGEASSAYIAVFLQD